MSPEPYWSDGQVTLHLGDCLEVLRARYFAVDATGVAEVLLRFPDGSVDAVVTDPPYGLEFMGKEWDRFSGAVTDRDFKGFVLSQQRTRNVKCPDCGKWAYDHPGRLCECGGVRRAQGSAFQIWCEKWAAECLRVLKPGGHMLAFGGTRTYHRLTCAIEDAGFEIRDSLHWIYGQGFPKSLDVSKAVGAGQCTCSPVPYTHGTDPQTEHDMPGLRDGDVPAPIPTRSGEGTVLLASVQEPGPSAIGAVSPAGGSWRAEPSLEGRRDVLQDPRELHRGSLRPGSGVGSADGTSGRLHHGAPARDGSVDRPPADPGGSGEPQGSRPVEQRPAEPGAVPDERGPQAGRGRPLCGRCGKPAVPRGLGTALKPAHEPIILARKPLNGTVAGNVLAHGTGALNVDGCRVGAPDLASRIGEHRSAANEFGQASGWNKHQNVPTVYDPGNGRWPPNVLLGPEAAEELDRQSGVLTSGANPTRRGSDKFRDAYGGFAGQAECTPHRGMDSGGASRFFPVFRYEAKAAAHERPRGEDGTAHPTVKPVDLMRWLVRLVTPPGGLVLDPFAGSGTTGEACIVEGFRCVLIEKDPSSVELIQARLRKPIQPDMFGGAA